MPHGVAVGNHERQLLLQRLEQLSSLLFAGQVEAARLGMVCLPGVMTPTEAFGALAAGATGLKLFPAELASPAVVITITTKNGGSTEPPFFSLARR